MLLVNGSSYVHVIYELSSFIFNFYSDHFQIQISNLDFTTELLWYKYGLAKYIHLATSHMLYKCSMLNIYGSPHQAIPRLIHSGINTHQNSPQASQLLNLGTPCPTFYLKAFADIVSSV